MAKKRSCTERTKKGKACKAPPLPDLDTCVAHSPKKTQESLGFGGAQEGAGRPRQPRPVEVLRERIEADIDRWLQPLEDAIDADRVVLAWDGNSMEVHYVPDHHVRLQAQREAFDRAFGKSKQLLEHTGEDGAPIQFEGELADPAVREALFDAARSIDAARRRR